MSEIRVCQLEIRNPTLGLAYVVQTILQIDGEMSFQYWIANMADKSRRMKKECQICGKKVTKLTSHMKVHNELKPFKCEFCERNFRFKGDLTRHIHTHTGTGTKKFKCNFLEQIVYQHIFEFTLEKSHSNAICVKDHFVWKGIYPTTFELIPNISKLMLEQNHKKN